ncbi:hypothetical protein U3516DRAFT_544105, partial [Neocallimastix sp. 'constans']
YNLHLAILESEKYDNLTCLTKFAIREYACCTNQNSIVEYVDNISNCGINNGKLCGLGYEKLLI